MKLIVDPVLASRSLGLCLSLSLSLSLAAGCASHTVNAPPEQSSPGQKSLAEGLGKAADTGVPGALRKALQEWLAADELSALGQIAVTPAQLEANTPGWRRLGTLAADRACCIFAQVALESAAAAELASYAEQVRSSCRQRGGFGPEQELVALLKRAAEAADLAAEAPRLPLAHRSRIRAAGGAARSAHDAAERALTQPPAAARAAAQAARLAVEAGGERRTLVRAALSLLQEMGDLTTRILGET